MLVAEEVAIPQVTFSGRSTYWGSAPVYLEFLRLDDHSRAQGTYRSTPH